MINNIDQLDLSKKYSYEDYLSWNFTDRVELIKGWLYKMSPGASMKHQRISLNFGSILHQHLRKTDCKVFQAPFDVRFINPAKTSSYKEIFDVVQPDVFVVCDPSKIDEKGCQGAPDIIFEILSKGNTKRDTQEKFNLYEENGVIEYWIISPQDEMVNIFELINGKYNFKGIYSRESTLTIKALSNFQISGEDLFEE
jgi:Uma2 family endonuclease